MRSLLALPLSDFLKFVALSAVIISCPSLALAEDPKDKKKNSLEGKNYGFTTKITAWNPDQNLGIIKTKKLTFVFRVDDQKSKIRVDRVVTYMQMKELKQGTPIYTLSSRTATPGRDFITLKPRGILAIGYAIEPLPTGKTKFPGSLDLLAWQTSKLLGWKLPVSVKIKKETVWLGAYGKEPILLASEGKLDYIKKKRRVRVEGVFKGKMKITIGNKFIPLNKKIKESGLKEVPLMEVSRIVILNTKFKKNYGYMFGDELNDPTKKKPEEGEVIRVGPLDPLRGGR